MTGIETDRLHLRPIRHSDLEDLIRVVSSDPDVVKGLAHDGSDPGARRAHAEGWIDYGPDGGAAMWRACGLALFVITDKTGAHAPPGALIGVSGVTVAREQGEWHGELLYALGSRYHGHGIASEATAAVVERFKAQSDAGSLYAPYWRILNPASGRILRRLGFADRGLHPLLEEFDADRLHGVRRFELWRLGIAESRKKPAVAFEAAIKLGHLAAVGIADRARNRADLLDAARAGDWAADLAPVIDAGLKTGADHAAMSLMQLDCT